MIILGFDPGTATTGYGIVESKSNPKHFRAIDYGCIITDPGDAGKRLQRIFQEINKLIVKHKPDLISVESLYFFNNQKTVMAVSQAKGVILLAASQKKIPLKEVTPMQVKMTVAGYGRADKKQVQKMIKVLLDLEDKPKDKNKRKDDATDALGIAICGAMKDSFHLST